MIDLPTASRLVRDAFKSRNQRKMRKANDKIMEAVALEFSKEMYALSVDSYVLSKILSKPRFMGKAYNEKHIEIDRLLSSMAMQAEKKDMKPFSNSLASLQRSIENVESSDSRFITGMMAKGRLKAAATLYAQGLSLSTASEITGVEKQEIMDYAGKTLMFDRVENGESLQKRLKKARSVLLGVDA